MTYKNQALKLSVSFSYCTEPISFDLMTNARDSLRQAVEFIILQEPADSHARLKHSITNAAHAIELLLKERLRREHPAFVWQNVDKYPSLSAHTVGSETALARVKSIAKVSLSEADEKHVKSLRDTRNAIEHYQWTTTASEARVIVGNALSFAFSFARDHLDTDLEEYFKQDDSWRMLLDELAEFTKAHVQRVRARMAEQQIVTTYCDSCEHETVPVEGGSCPLCGYWQYADDNF
jgi:hypothetical protein